VSIVLRQYQATHSRWRVALQHAELARDLAEKLEEAEGALSRRNDRQFKALSDRDKAAARRWLRTLP